MSIAPELADLVAVDAGDLVDWDAYLKCGTCRVPAGGRCRALYTRIVDGRPDGPTKLLPVPHAHRRRRRKPVAE